MRSTGSSQIPPSPGPSVRRPVARARRRKVSRPTSTAGGGGSSKSPRGHQEARLRAPERVERVRQQLGAEVPVDARDRHGRVGRRGSASSSPVAGRSWRAVCSVTHAAAGRTTAAQAGHVVERAGAADEA